MVTVLVMLERLKKRSEMASASFRSPIFTCTSSSSRFRVSPPPPRGNTSGDLYIWLFRSRRSIWDEDRQHQSFEGQTRLGCVTWTRARATSARLDPGGPLMCFFISSCCSRKIVTLEKASHRLSSRTTNIYSLFRLYCSNYMSNGTHL
jgi:hypothetical protein